MTCEQVVHSIVSDIIRSLSLAVYGLRA